MRVIDVDADEDRSCDRGADACGLGEAAAAALVFTSSLVKMRLVWVRRVLMDTNSWRAISGPLRGVASSRRTSSSRSLSVP